MPVPGSYADRWQAANSWRQCHLPEHCIPNMREASPATCHHARATICFGLRRAPMMASNAVCDKSPKAGGWPCQQASR